MFVQTQELLSSFYLLKLAFNYRMNVLCRGLWTLRIGIEVGVLLGSSGDMQPQTLDRRGISGLVEVKSLDYLLLKRLSSSIGFIDREHDAVKHVVLAWFHDGDIHSDLVNVILS